MTGFNSNINELIEKFKAIKTNAQNIDLSDALLAGVNAGKGAMENRIFNRGLDINNNPLGEYRGEKQNVKNTFSEFLVGTPGQLRLTPYQRKRVKKGRQVRYKDLEFQGALRRGIVVIKESQVSVVCAIPNEDLFNISQYQEEDLHTKIFGLSEEEKEVLRTNVIAVSKQIYDRIFNT